MVFFWELIDFYKVMEFVLLVVKFFERGLVNKIVLLMVEWLGLFGEKWSIIIVVYFKVFEEEVFGSFSEDDLVWVGQQYKFWFKWDWFLVFGCVLKLQAIEVFDYFVNWVQVYIEGENSNNIFFLVLAEQVCWISVLFYVLLEEQLIVLELEWVVCMIYEFVLVQFNCCVQGFLWYINRVGSVIGLVSDLVWWNFVQVEKVYFFFCWYELEC